MRAHSDRVRSRRRQCVSRCCDDGRGAAEHGERNEAAREGEGAPREAGLRAVVQRQRFRSAEMRDCGVSQLRATAHHLVFVGRGRRGGGGGER